MIKLRANIEKYYYYIYSLLNEILMTLSKLIRKISKIAFSLFLIIEQVWPNSASY